MKNNHHRSVNFAKRAAMLRKISGSKGSHNATNARSLGIFKKTVDLKIRKKKIVQWKKSGESCLFYACLSPLEAKAEACYLSTCCSNDKESQWFLDNGCTNHMTANKKFFVDMELADSKVRLGNGALVDVQGRGSIESKLKWIQD